MRNFAYVVLPTVALLNMGIYAAAVADAATRALESVHERQIHNADYSTSEHFPQPNDPNTGSTSSAPSQPLPPPSREAAQANRKGDVSERPPNTVKSPRDTHLQSTSAHASDELVKSKGRAFPRSPPKKSNSALPSIPGAPTIPGIPQLPHIARGNNAKKSSPSLPVPAVPGIPALPIPAIPSAPKLSRDTDSKKPHNGDSSPRKVPNVKESHPKRAKNSEGDLPVPADAQSKLPRRGTDSKKPHAKQASILPDNLVPALPPQMRRGPELKTSQDGSSSSPAKPRPGVPRSTDLKESHSAHSHAGEEPSSTVHGKMKASRNSVQETPGDPQDEHLGLRSEHLAKLPRGSGDADTKNTMAMNKTQATNKSQSEPKNDQAHSPLDPVKTVLPNLPIPREIAAQKEASNNDNAPLSPLDSKGGSVELSKTGINLKRQADERRWEQQDSEHAKVIIRSNGNNPAIVPHEQQAASLDPASPIHTSTA